MSDAASNTNSIGQPAPEGQPVDLYTLAFGVLAAPVVWGLALVSTYAVASNACFSGHAPELNAAVSGTTWSALLAIILSAFVISAAAALVSYRSWSAVPREHAEPVSLLAVGEGRTRFLAIWGMLTSILFAGLILLSVIAILVLPLCGF